MFWDAHPKAKTRRNPDYGAILRAASWAKPKKARKAGKRVKATVKRVKKVVRAKSWFAKPKARKGWFGEGAAHAFATHIGRTYMEAAKSRVPGAMYKYAARRTKRGKHKGTYVSRASLRKYRSERKTPVSRLEARREWYKHKATPKASYVRAMSRAKRRYGMLYNASSYQKFIGKHVRGARGVGSARKRFKAAVKAWKSMHRGGKSSRRRGKARHSNNPVLPYMAFSNKRRKASRKRARRNPLYRTARGRYTGHHATKKLRRISGGGWKANRRRYRDNGILPYAAFSNPMEALMGTVTKLSDVSLWTKTVLPLAGGFIGTHIVAFGAVKLITGSDFKTGSEGTYAGLVKHGARAGAAILLSVATGMVTKDTDMAAKVLGGGLVAVLGGLLEDILGADYKKITGMGDYTDLGDDLSNELKARIAEGVRSRMNGLGGPVSSFVTQEELNQAPRLGDFLTSQALRNATVGSGLAARAGGGPPRGAQPLADIATFQDAMADGQLI